MARTIIVGDVHGCLEELRSLVEKLRITHEDQLLFVGDLVARGPDSLGVLDLVRELGARCVRGNHEDKLIRDRDAQGGAPHPALSPSHARIASSLREVHWAQLRAMPLWIDLPDHEVRVVHAGVVPGREIATTPANVLVSIRGLSADGTPSKLRSAEPWARRYVGPPHVVFGHHALLSAQLHPWATGIDMGCVYGGFLAAIVLEPHARVPAIEHRHAAICSVPARKVYCPIGIR